MVHQRVVCNYYVTGVRVWSWTMLDGSELKLTPNIQSLHHCPTLHRTTDRPLLQALRTSSRTRAHGVLPKRTKIIRRNKKAQSTQHEVPCSLQHARQEARCGSLNATLYAADRIVFHTRGQIVSSFRIDMVFGTCVRTWARPSCVIHTLS